MINVIVKCRRCGSCWASAKKVNPPEDADDQRAYVAAAALAPLVVQCPACPAPAAVMN